MIKNGSSNEGSIPHTSTLLLNKQLIIGAKMSIPEYQLEWLRKHNPEVAEEMENMVLILSLMQLLAGLLICLIFFMICG